MISSKVCRSHLASLLEASLVSPLLAAQLVSYRSLDIQFKSPLLVLTTHRLNARPESTGFFLKSNEYLLVLLAASGDDLPLNTIEDALDDITDALIAAVESESYQDTPYWVSLSYQALETDTITVSGTVYRRARFILTLVPKEV